jgi:hypothetical protein
MFTPLHACSGLLANAVADWTTSFVAPFLLAIVFLAIGGGIVALTWNENYGESNQEVITFSML